MKLYRLREEDKKFLWALLSATGVILFWRGIWEVSYDIPLLENVYFVLFVGLLILTLTGFIYREFDVFGQKIYRIAQLIHEAVNETKRGVKYTIHYFDGVKGDTHKVSGSQIEDVEVEFFVIHHKGHEVYIPFKRITKIMKGNKVVWRK